MQVSMSVILLFRTTYLLKVVQRPCDTDTFITVIIFIAFTTLFVLYYQALCFILPDVLVYQFQMSFETLPKITLRLESNNIFMDEIRA
jgi:hypothetical protein